jgi:tripartite-type tricarboxylate transporter receptor subunit TctC
VIVMSMVDRRTAPSPTGAAASPDAPPSRRAAWTVVACFSVLAAVLALLDPSALTGPSRGADTDFAGDSIEITIPLAEGGGTDTWARYIASNIERHIPGSPATVPENVPGGEGITGSNAFASSAAADGRHLLVSTATSVLPYVLGRGEVRYDFARLKPVMVNGSGGALYASSRSGIRSLRDLRSPSEPLVFGGISATGLDATTLVAFDLLGLQVKSIFGFEGRGPVRLALERGEVNLDYQTTSTYRSQVQPLVAEGKAVPLMSFGVLNEDGEIVRDPNLPDLPTVAEAYQEIHGSAPGGVKYEAYRALLALTYTYQKGMWVPEETPDEVVETLRRAARRMAADPAFVKQSGELLGGYPLEAGDDVAAKVAEAYTVNDEVRGYLVDLLTTKYGVRID